MSVMARTLVLVAGSGRSGTSLFSGILQRLGFYVPLPEVPADATNPRGFAESQWVVDFHTRLLKRARVQVSDARPTAWAETGRVGLDDVIANELNTWLAAQFADHPALVIKDPRLSWFLPLWRRTAAELDASPCFVTMVRHPAAVIDSKQTWYGGNQGETGRAAGWLNQTLFTERATRGAPRAFVRYDDLLEDWTQTVGQIGEHLDLDVVRDAPANSLRAAHDLIDRGLSRSRPDWGDTTVPDALRALADDVWELTCELAKRDGHEAELDAVRGRYIDLYKQAEALAGSSIDAARKKAPAKPAPVQTAPAVVRKVPVRYRRLVPVGLRRRVVRTLARRRRTAPAR